MTALTRPSLGLFDAWAACIVDFEPGHVHASGSWPVGAEPEPTREYCTELVAAIERAADTAQPAPEGVVHADTYWITDGDEVVGFLQLRHTLDEFLRDVGGHVGLSVRRECRGRGYASRALRLSLDRARELGTDQVLVTCDEDNVASRATIEGVGGVLEDVRQGKRRYWVAAWDVGVPARRPTCGRLDPTCGRLHRERS